MTDSGGDPTPTRRLPAWPEPPGVSPEEQARLEALAEHELEEAERTVPRRTTRQVLRIVVLLTLVLLTLYVLGPGLVEVLSSAPRLREIGWWWFPLMLVLEVGSFACMWAVQWIAVRRTDWWQISTSQLASNAFGRVVPGGGAAAGALQYRMLVDAGAPRGTTATGLTAANLLTFGVLLGLPVLAVPAILEGRVDSGIRSLLVWATMILLALVAGGVILVVTDSPLRWVGSMAQRTRNRLRPGRPPMTDLPDRLVRERDLIVRVVGERWKRALSASLGKALLDFGVLLVALEAVGRQSRAVAGSALVRRRAAARPDPDHPGRPRVRRGGAHRLPRARRRVGWRRGPGDARLSPLLVLAADSGGRPVLVALPPPAPVNGIGRARSRAPARRATRTPRRRSPRA